MGTYGTRPQTIEPYNNKYSISLMCTYRKVPLQIHTTSYVESVPSVQIQFMNVIGFRYYINRGIKSTEDRICSISLGRYMATSPPQDQLIISIINTSLLDLHYNGKLNLDLSTLRLLPYL